MTEPADRPSNNNLPVVIAGQVRDAMASGEDVRVRVEQIVRDALTDGRLDVERVREVVRAVGEGVSSAAERQSDAARQAVGEAVAGLQAALGASAESASLAIEEAASRVDEYSNAELRRAVAELGRLESMMLDTLEQAASAGSRAGAGMLTDLVQHARRNGTRLGTDVSESMRALAMQLPEAMRESALSGLEAMREAGTLAFEAASGAFEGLADALRANARPTRRGGDAADDDAG